MKKFIVMTGLILLAASCSNECLEQESDGTGDGGDGVVPVRVCVSDFSMSVDEFQKNGTQTRAAQDVADYKGVGAITLAFYSETTEVLKTTQMRNDASTYTTFGEFECNLPIGTYTMVVVARGYTAGDEFTLISATEAGYTSERPRETFCKTQTVSVTSSGASFNVTLERVIAKLEIHSTDPLSASVATMRTTYAAGSKSFNPGTGLATSDAGFSLTNSPSKMGDGTLGIGSYLFLSANEQKVNVTIQALDASSNVLFTKTVTDVPFKRNRITTLSGAIFTASASAASFQVEADWLTGTSMDF